MFLTAALSKLSYATSVTPAEDGFEPPTNSSDNPQSTARLNHCALGTPKRFRSAETNTALAFAESISSGEEPRRIATRIIMRMSTAVISKLGHAFSAHCPDQVSCTRFENGRR